MILFCRASATPRSCPPYRLSTQAGLTLMELLIAVALSGLVVTLVAGVASFVGKRYQRSVALQQVADERAHIHRRLQLEFSEIVIWHETRGDRLVYSSSYTAPGEKREPYTSTLLCRRQPDVDGYDLVYQRAQRDELCPSAVRNGQSSGFQKTVQEIILSLTLKECTVQFGVLGVTPSSEQKMLRWLAAPEPGGMDSVVQLRIVTSGVDGAYFPIIISKGKR